MIDYARDTIEWARNNPHISIGMMVTVYNCDDPHANIYCGIGLVKEITWDSFYESYLCDVDFEDGRSYTVLMGTLERRASRDLRAVK